MSDAPRAVDLELALAWATMYASLVHRATHEVNNALNAVAMNLEVVRLRAVPGADAGRIAPFAAAAADAHDEVVAMVRPLMALARALPAGGCDVREVAAQVVAVLAPGVRAKGGSLVLDGDGRGARTSAPAAAVRLATASLLEAATRDAAREWRCVVTDEPERMLALVPAPAGERGGTERDGTERDGAVARLCARADVRAGPVAWSLVFPSP